MIACQRRETNIGRRCRIDPDRLIDLPARRDLTGHIDPIQASLHPKARLIRCDSIELAERPDRGRDQAATELLRDFAREGCDVVFAGSRLPPGCMKAVVPRLRTNSTRPASSRISAAMILIVPASITRPHLRSRTGRTAPDRAPARRGRDGERRARSTAARAGCAADSRTGSGTAR